MTIELRLSDAMLTDDTVLSLTRRNPGYRFERSADGKLIVAPSGLLASGGEGELFAQVLAFAKSTRSGRAFPATGGFTLPDTSIVAPDTTFVTNETLAKLSADELSHAYVRVVPDVVFELLSPTDRRADAVLKLKRYIAQGVRTAVLITPESVTIERADGTRSETSSPTVVVGDAMRGFVLDVAAIAAASLAP